MGMALQPSSSTPTTFPSLVPLLISAAVGAGLTAATTCYWLSRRPSCPAGRTPGGCQHSHHACEHGDARSPAVTQRQHELQQQQSLECSVDVCDAPVCVIRPNIPANKNRRDDPYDPTPRSDYLSWDDYFMAVAFLSAERSKDPSKQVGACIVDQHNVILGIGYNGFPRGCADAHLPWAKRSATNNALDTKYPYVVHAEANALLNKNSASVEGARCYVTMFPCNECAKLLIQAGIREVIYHEAKLPGASQPSVDGVKAQQQQQQQPMAAAAADPLTSGSRDRPVEPAIDDAAPSAADANISPASSTAAAADSSLPSTTDRCADDSLATTAGRTDQTSDPPAPAAAAAAATTEAHSYLPFTFDAAPTSSSPSTCTADSAPTSRGTGATRAPCTAAADAGECAPAAPTCTSASKASSISFRSGTSCGETQCEPASPALATCPCTSQPALAGGRSDPATPVSCDATRLSGNSGGTTGGTRATRCTMRRGTAAAAPAAAVHQAAAASRTPTSRSSLRKDGGRFACSSSADHQADNPAAATAAGPASPVMVDATNTCKTKASPRAKVQDTARVPPTSNHLAHASSQLHSSVRTARLMTSHAGVRLDRVRLSAVRHHSEDSRQAVLPSPLASCSPACSASDAAGGGGSLASGSCTAHSSLKRDASCREAISPVGNGNASDAAGVLPVVASPADPDAAGGSGAVGAAAPAPSAFSSCWPDAFKLPAGNSDSAAASRHGAFAAVPTASDDAPLDPSQGAAATTAQSSAPTSTTPPPVQQPTCSTAHAEVKAAPAQTPSVQQAAAGVEVKADPSYLASQRLLSLAGVGLRQHRLQRHLAIPPWP